MERERGFLAGLHGRVLRPRLPGQACFRGCSSRPLVRQLATLPDFLYKWAWALTTLKKPQILRINNYKIKSVTFPTLFSVFFLHTFLPSHTVVLGPVWHRDVADADGAGYPEPSSLWRKRAFFFMTILSFWYFCPWLTSAAPPSEKPALFRLCIGIDDRYTTTFFCIFLQ